MEAAPLHHSLVHSHVPSTCFMVFIIFACCFFILFHSILSSCAHIYFLGRAADPSACFLFFSSVVSSLVNMEPLGAAIVLKEREKCLVAAALHHTLRYAAQQTQANSCFHTVSKTINKSAEVRSLL